MKRVLAPFLLICLLFTCCSSVLAADIDVQSNPTLSLYDAKLAKGSSAGKIVIRYQLTASKMASSIGVSSIKIYKSDGTYITTITGTTANKLIANNKTTYSNTYTYSGVSGTSYYAKVTMFATAGGVTSSGTVKTNTVTAP